MILCAAATPAPRAFVHIGKILGSSAWLFGVLCGRCIKDSKSFLLALFAIGFSACSNAPPNFYAIGKGSEIKPQVVASGRIILPAEPLFNRYDDTAKVMRSDGLEGSPTWGNIIDVFTLSIDMNHGIFHYGAYTSNLYPGIYSGIRSDHFGAALYCTASIPSLKVLPGLQINGNLKAFSLSYSLYQENMGSVQLLPWLGEPGPSRKVLSEKYIFGMNISRQFGVSAYVNRSYWENIRSAGLEFIVTSTAISGIE